MEKKDIIRKLTSRKLWVAVASFVTGLIVALDGSAEVAEVVSGLIMSGATAIAYIIGEGLTDAAHTEDHKE
jgi:tetrahydromethanopterin S-methyltransferase subunit C